jgi:Spy/CpxP family protein refolding chaperone
VRPPKPVIARPAPTAKTDDATSTSEPSVKNRGTPPSGARSRPALAILADPQVADELGLSEEQRRALDELQQQTPDDELPEAALEVLTPEQRARFEQREAAGSAAS